MVINYYEIEFYTWDSIMWKEIHVEIKALTMISLMKEFLKCEPPNTSELLSEKLKMKKFWNEQKKYISKNTMTFPIVTKKNINY